MMPIFANDDVPDVEVQQVRFRSDGIWEFIYTERRNVTEDGALVNVLTIDSAKLPAQDVAELQEALRDLIDEGLIVLRNPDARR